ncbi:HD-GYP domain-containing protein [Dethiothermospora halolimnae]|uniref:HD-GYP domain-containing protein n=1 Tax=Dethiothermospora halolimnae TaxID=3114390 RepID=UPI003CCB95D2
MTVMHITDLKPGMILERDVEKKDSGITILSSGTVLNKRSIMKMRNLEVENVHIFEKKERNEGIVLTDDEEFKEKYDILSNKTQDILNNAKLGKKIIISEISDSVNDVIDGIIDNNNILKRLRQLEEDDEYIFKHSMNVLMLATMIGKWLKYSKRELKQLSLAALLHDIGKVKIPNNILNKPGKLTEKEFDIIKKHTIHGFNILNDTVGISKSVALGALQHHERIDGSGYPLKVKSEKIHEFAKIIAVCDIFNAMTSERVYKHKESPFKVAEHISRSSFEKLDPRVSSVFLDNISKFYVGNVVKLNNGEIGEIILVHRQMPTRPIVRIDDKYIDLLRERKYEIVEIIN